MVYREWLALLQMVAYRLPLLVPRIGRGRAPSTHRFWATRESGQTIMDQGVRLHPDVLDAFRNGGRAVALVLTIVDEQFVLKTKLRIEVAPIRRPLRSLS